MRNRVQKLLGGGRHDSPLRAEGTITRTDGRFHLELVVRVGEVTGTRSLAARSCEDLAGAAAVEIGLLVHSVEDTSKPDQGGTQTPILLPAGPPEASGSTSGSSSGSTSGSSSGSTSGSTPGSSSGSTSGSSSGGIVEGTSRPSTQGKNDVGSADRAPDRARTEATKPIEPEATAPPQQPETPRTWRALVQAPTVALGLGPLPPLALGVGFALGIEHARWQVQLQGLSWRRQNVPATGFPGYGADVDRLAAGLWTCRESRLDWLGLSPCLLAAIERVSATGTRANITPTTRHTMGASVGAGMQGRVALASWLRLVAAAGVEILLVRPQLLIDGLGPMAPPPKGDPPDPPTPIYRFAPAALTATLSLEWAM